MNWPAELLRDPNGLRLVESLEGTSSLDVATATLYRQILESDRRFLPIEDDAPIRADPETLILVMPGAFHREHPHTGADGQRVIELAKTLGCDVERIAVGSFDSMQTNADVLSDTLRRFAHRRIILVSLSKGSADVKAAIQSTPEAFGPVRVWVSFSGLLNGTPLVQWLRKRRLRWLGVRALLWWQRQSINTLLELQCGLESQLKGWPSLPAHLRLVQVVGVPLRRHLQHKWAPRGYERLASLGPNDGGALLLSDTLNCPGQIYPVWGADHYLQPDWNIDPLLRSLMRTALYHTNSIEHP